MNVPAKTSRREFLDGEEHVGRIAFQKTFHPNMSIVLGTTVLFVSGLGMSLFARRGRASTAAE